MLIFALTFGAILTAYMADRLAGDGTLSGNDMTVLGLLAGLSALAMLVQAAYVWMDHREDLLRLELEPDVPDPVAPAVEHEETP